MRLWMCFVFLLLLALPGPAGAQVPLPPLVGEQPPGSDGPPESQEPPESSPPAEAPPAGRGRGRRPSSPPRRRTLSDERTESRWAHVVRAVWARARPALGARRVRRLGLRTPDGTRELVLALEERRLRGGETWLRVRLPMRPNNTTGWIPRRGLGRLHVVRTFLRVDRGHLRATFYRRGRVVWRAPIGVGESGSRTPRGRFYVRERLIPTDPSGLYGVFAFGLSAYSETLTDWPRGGMIGIHGTNQPELLPGRVSHGCVRLINARIARLRRLMTLGTPVEIF